jgi:hypothetical protein
MPFLRCLSIFLLIWLASNARDDCTQLILAMCGAKFLALDTAAAERGQNNYARYERARQLSVLPGSSFENSNCLLLSFRSLGRTTGFLFAFFLAMMCSGRPFG